MEDPAHGADNNPFFRVVLKNDACQVVNELCIIANVQNNSVEVANIVGFKSIIYKQWTCDSFDLTPYIGDSVTIEFIAADCGWGAHFGYAYVADICDDCASMPHIALDTLVPVGCGLPQFCGTLTFGEDYKFVDLQLDITQMGQILNSSSNYTYDDSTGVYCFDVLPSDTIGLGVGGFDVFGVAHLINLNGDTISVRSLTAVLNTVDTVDNDFFLPVESCCPDSLTVGFTSQEFMPVFGGNDCDELIYYVEGTILIPSGYVYCDSLPVFDYAFIIYDDINYINAGPFNMVLWTGHLHITDPQKFQQNNGVPGTMLVCDDETGEACPADIFIPYHTPMTGMMCNFSHCVDEPCDGVCGPYSAGDMVPVKSCMTFQFPQCGTCQITSYTIYILRPSGGKMDSLTVTWDGTSAEQDYCVQLSYPYAPGNFGCYYFDVISSCGDRCLSSFCIDYLNGCTGYPGGRSASYPKGSVPDESELIVYPNPNTGAELTVIADFVEGRNLSYVITSISGQVVVSQTLGNTQSNFAIDVQKLESGTYFLTVSDNLSGETRTIQFVRIE
jgi:hypothetical protein